MKVIWFVLLLASFVFAQQMNYTSGLKKTSGDLWTNEGITYIDTTTGTTNDILIDLQDYLFAGDINPLVNDDSAVVAINSNRFYVGTFYVLFDNQGTASPTTDSLKYTIKAYPGIYTTESKTVAGAKYGTAVTLETVKVHNDYFSINNVYLHATKYKHFPSELIKLELAPVGSKNCDDSTQVNWRFVYPQVIKTSSERISSED